jgi:hypothetical protein
MARKEGYLVLDSCIGGNGKEERGQLRDLKCIEGNQIRSMGGGEPREKWRKSFSEGDRTGPLQKYSSFGITADQGPLLLRSDKI